MGTAAADIERLCMIGRPMLGFAVLNPTYAWNNRSRYSPVTDGIDVFII